MIFDRTFQDVVSAIDLIRIKGRFALTEEDLRKLERGMVTRETINRISQKQIELDNALKEMLYFGDEIYAKIWNEDDFFTEKDLSTLASDTAKLRSRFMVFYETPINPRAEYHFQEFNKMEKILFDIERMIKSVKENYRECGNYECGV